MSAEDRTPLLRMFTKIYKQDPARFNELPGISPAWDPKRLVILYEMLCDGEEYTHADMADAVGLERSTITRKVNNVDWEDFGDVLTTLCSVTRDEAIRNAAVDKRDKEFMRIDSRLRKREIANKAFLIEFEDIIESKVGTIPRVIFPKVRSESKTSATPEEMGLLLSDIHVGQEFSVDETGGLGHYGMSQFVDRSNNLRLAVAEIYKLHSKIRRVPVLNIFGLGDFVQGANLAGQWGPAYTAMDVAEQAITAAQVVAEMVDYWASFFDKVVFTGVIGNHGRAGPKGGDKLSANWDLIAYALLKAMMKDRDNVEINYDKSWWACKRILNSDFMLVHGDFVSNSINQLAKEEVRLQNLVSSSIGKPFDYLCMGHYHSWMDMQTTRGAVMVNGSFVGGDIHSLHQMRRSSRPSQVTFGVHPSHGVTWRYTLDLDYERE